MAKEKVIKFEHFGQVEINCFYVASKGKLTDFEYSCFEGNEAEKELAKFEKVLIKQIQKRCKKEKPKADTIYFVEWEGVCSPDTGRLSAEKVFKFNPTQWKMSLGEFKTLEKRLQIQHSKDLKSEEEDY